MTVYPIHYCTIRYYILIYPVHYIMLEPSLHGFISRTLYSASVHGSRRACAPERERRVPGIGAEAQCHGAATAGAEWGRNPGAALRDGTGVGCAPTSLGVAFAPTASGGRGARDPGVGANVTPVHFAWQVQQLEHLNRDVHGRGGTCSTCKHVGSATDSSYVA